ncbi:MAG: hypothetical protein R3181_10055, partial [Rubricoccaceae bacterium]|nr:hypothetical protein [Rubricoccaceae bacterium]
HSSVLALLLTRSVVGELAEAQLFGLSDLLDDVEASATERAAFARFYLEALTEEGEVPLPKAEELTALLAFARA